MGVPTPSSPDRRGGGGAGYPTSTGTSLGAAWHGLADAVAEDNLMTRMRTRPKQRFPLIGAMLEAGQRERGVLLSEASKVRGLMPLLMKRRNGNCWTRDDRALLHEQMRALAHLSPYLIILALPGSFAMMPVLAWWLDRRRGGVTQRR